MKIFLFSFGIVKLRQNNPGFLFKVWIKYLIDTVDSYLAARISSIPRVFALFILVFELKISTIQNIGYELSSKDLKE